MTHRMLRDTAKQLAGAFYEQNMRSPMFRRAYPTASDFIHGRGHRRDGSIQIMEPGWWAFQDMAKKALTGILRDKATPDYMKERVSEALIDNAMRGSRAEARRHIQTDLEKREDKPPEQAMVRI